MTPTYQSQSCTGKIRHRSKHAAKKHLKSLANASGGIPKKSFEVYRCSYCANFHVGHKRPEFTTPWEAAIRLSESNLNEVNCD